MILFNQKSTKRNFVWYCDPCLTHLEAVGTDGQPSQSNKVDDLEKKIDLLTTQVSSITDMLTPSIQQSTNSVLSDSPVGNNVPVRNNAWQNTSKVMIMKNNLGTPNLQLLEEKVVDNQIQVINSRKSKNGDIIITCPSSTAA